MLPRGVSKGSWLSRSAEGLGSVGGTKKQAQEFAGRVVRKTGDDPDRFVDHAWKLALARAPTAREKSEALTLFRNFVNKAQAGAAVGPVAEPLENPPASLAALPGERAAALAKLCLGIYNLNEFLFID